MMRDKYEEAEALCAQLKETIRTHYDETDLFWLNACMMHGMLLLSKGDYEGAEVTINANLDLFEKKFGEEHELVLGALGLKIAILFNKEQHEYRPDYSELEDLAEKHLILLKNKYGENHFQLIEAKDNLAAIYAMQEKYDEAVKLFREVHDLQLRHYEPEHHKVLSTMHNLAFALEGQQKTDQALALYKEVLDQQIKVFGEGHSRTFDTLESIGSLHIDQEDYEKGIAYYSRLLECSKNLYGMKNPETIGVLDAVAGSTLDLAWVTEEDNHFQEAEKLYKQLIEIQGEVLGLNDQGTLTNMNDLALILSELGKSEESLEMLQKTYKGLCDTLGEADSESLNTLINIGSTYMEMDRKEEAEEIFDNILKKSTQFQNLDQERQLYCLLYYSKALNDLKKFEEAEKFGDRALALIGTHYEEGSMELLDAMTNSATIKANLEKYTESIELFEKSLALSLANHGVDHYMTDYIQFNLGKAFMEQGDHLEAEKLLQKVFQYRKEKHGDDHTKTKEARDRLAKLNNLFEKN
jgi:tetratricopeptide (TPR) repeat protein